MTRGHPAFFFPSRSFLFVDLFFDVYHEHFASLLLLAEAVLQRWGLSPMPSVLFRGLSCSLAELEHGVYFMVADFHFCNHVLLALHVSLVCNLRIGFPSF